MLQKLHIFEHFDIDGFLKDKNIIVKGVRKWTDRETGKLLGSKVDTIIVADNTDYGISENEEVISNLFETLTIKVPKIINKLPMKTEVRPINAKAKIYGDYHNQLSIVAENIEVIKKQ